MAALGEPGRAECKGCVSLNLKPLILLSKSEGSDPKTSVLLRRGAHLAHLHPMGILTFKLTYDISVESSSSSGRALAALGELWQLWESSGNSGRALGDLWESSGRPLGELWQLWESTGSSGRPWGHLWESYGTLLGELRQL